MAGLRRLPVAGTGRNLPVSLGDLASLEILPAPSTSISRIDGKPVVTIVLDRAVGSHFLGTASKVQETLRKLRHELPPGVLLQVADDRSAAVRAELRSLLGQGATGLLLLIGVLAAVLRGLRATAATLLTVAVSVAMTAVLFRFLGMTLNLLTLGGLVLAVGLLIDNAVIVIERMQTLRRRRGETFAVGRVGLAVADLWLPLLGGTTTTMVVLLPLIYLSGELRALFIPFGILLALSLAFSLLAAAMVAPVLGDRLDLEPNTKKSNSRWVRRGAGPLPLVRRLAAGSPCWRWCCCSACRWAACPTASPGRPATPAPGASPGSTT